MVLSRLALALAVLAALPAAADTQKKPPVSAQAEAAQKKADIKRYLQISDGVGQRVATYRRTVVDMKKGSSREIPDTFWAELAGAITPEAFEPAVADVYDKSYSAPVLRDIVKLLDTPAFRKFSQIEQTTVQKAIGAALQKHMEDASAGSRKAAPGTAIPAAKRADIAKFLKATDAVNRQVESARKSIVAQRKAVAKDVPDAVWADLSKAATPEAFEGVMAEVYDKHYTAQEMKALVQIIDNKLFKDFAYAERTKVSKDVESALDRVVNDLSKQLMAKHKAGKAEAPSADAKKG